MKWVVYKLNLILRHISSKLASNYRGLVYRGFAGNLTWVMD